MVAKIPLLISSRMTSAGLTVNSSASSLTVIVAGSSIAPRSRGSATWTCPGTPLPSRRGGFLRPRLPRVPLLLRATGSSFVSCHHHRRSGSERLSQLHRKRCLERAPESASPESGRPARGIPAEVRTPAGDAAGFINHQFPARRPDDPNELTLGPDSSARHARSIRRPTWNAGSSLPGYDEASPPSPADAAVAFFVRDFFGATAAASGSASASALAPSPATAFAVAAFFARGLAVAGTASASAVPAVDAIALAARGFFGALAGFSGVASVATAAVPLVDAVAFAARTFFGAVAAVGSAFAARAFFGAVVSPVEAASTFSSVEA